MNNGSFKVFLCLGVGFWLMSAGAAAAEYPPPFAAGPGTETVKTRLLTGKVTVGFAGTALNLKMFPAGEVNLFSPDDRLRWGALVVEKNRKGIPGKRVKKGDRGYALTYAASPGLEQSLTLRPDGRVEWEFADADGLGQTEMVFMLIREFFGGATMEIDGRRFQLPVYREEEPQPKTFWDAPAGRVVFFADVPARAFSIDFPQPTRIRLFCGGGRYGLTLRLIPAATDKVLSMVVTPGTTSTGGDAAPAGYATKVGKYDFWAEDRLRLPDRRNRNLLQNSSFEQGFASLWFSQCVSGGRFSREMWTEKPIRIDRREAWNGRASLRIMSDAPKANMAQRIATQSILLEPGDYTFSVYAKTDKPGQQSLTVTFALVTPGSNIWRKKGWINRKYPLTGQWQRYELHFKIAQTAPYYFLFGAASPERADCYLDAMQLERGGKATAYVAAPAEGRLVTSASDNLIEFGRKIAARLEVTTAKPKESGMVAVTVRDFFGRVVRRLKKNFTTGADGKGEVALELEGLPRGIYTVENQYRLADKSERYEFTRLAVMSFLHNTHRHKNLFTNVYIDPYGICQFYPELLERYRRVGIGSRAGFANTEKLVAEEAAKYGVDSFSSTILRADRQLTAERPKTSPGYGYTILNNIVWYECPAVDCRRVDYAKIILPGYTPEELRKVEEGAARRAGEAPWVRIWGVFNEPEGHMPEFAHCGFAADKNFREYVEVELAAAKGARRGNPKAMVGNSACSCLRTDRIDTLDKLLTCIGDRFRYDCFLIHTYREAPEYPDLDADFQRLFAMLARHGYQDTPIYCPEGMHWKPYKMDGLINIDWVDVPRGPLSYDMGHQERLSAALRARQWLIGLKWQDRVKLMNSSTNFWGFEMDFNLTPYATQKISNTLGRLLGNASFVKDVRLSDQTRCYVFEDECQRPVAALWQCSPEVDHGLKPGAKLRFAGLPEVELWDLMEVQHPFKSAADGSSTLRLSSFPMFLRGHTGGTAALLAALENAELSNEGEPAASAVFALHSPTRFGLTFRNTAKREFAGTVSLGGGKEVLSLAPGEVRTLTAALPAELTSRRLTHESLSAELAQTRPVAGRFGFREEFAAVLARRAVIKVDGSLDDWKEIPALELSTCLLGPKTSSVPSAADFSARVRLAWSPEAFYLAVEVRDDKLSVLARSLPRDGWRNDSLQVFFDSFGDARRRNARKLDQDDWSYGIYLKDPSGNPYVYRHHVPDAQLTRGVLGAKVETLADDVTVAFRKTADGYLYELGFSRGSVAPFRLAAGEVLGLGLMLNDQDDGGPTPKSRLVFGHAAVAPQNGPALWPAVMLVEKE